jgi:hypothetical protein
MMTFNVFSWWLCLCAVGSFNVAAWTVSAIALRRRRPALTAETLRLRRLQLILSALYVAGCAFRSAVPVYDVPRICLFDQWFASVLVGRSVATIAELCFVAQWALMLHEISRSSDSVIGRFTSVALLPLIAVAETCSWYSVLTTSNIGHVAEESLWAFCVALLVASALTVAPRCSARWRAILLGWCVVGMVYVAFMVAVDVPMYWARWLTDQAAGRHYMSLAQGFMDIASRRVVSYRWADWRHEIAWMSLYFSVAVWISISLVHVPEMKPLQALRERRLPRKSLTRGMGINLR